MRSSTREHLNGTLPIAGEPDHAGHADHADQADATLSPVVSADASEGAARAADPGRAQRLPQRLVIACGVSILAATGYAVWPVAQAVDSGSDTLADTSPSARGPSPGASIDPAPTAPAMQLTAFSTPLWVAPIPPPPPPPPAQPPPPPPPIKLQLIGIAADPASGELSAMLYDPDSGKLLSVRKGQVIGERPGGDRTVEAITATGVSLRDGFGLRTLSLKSSDGPGLPMTRSPSAPPPEPPAEDER